MILKNLIIIPTLNEKNNVKRIYIKIKKLKNLAFDLLFIDDNSDDGTQEEILNLSSKKNIYYLFRKRKGLGSAHRDGINWAIKKKYNICVTIDADGSHNPKLIKEMYSIIKNNKIKVDIINTNRFLKKKFVTGMVFFENSYNKNKIYFSKVIFKYISRLIRRFTFI